MTSDEPRNAPYPSAHLQLSVVIEVLEIDFGISNGTTYWRTERKLLASYPFFSGY